MKAEVLRKSILQMAIQGKLVPQNSSDEPASVLLQKIRAEKEKLIKEGKIKRDKETSSIIESEIPFDIPETWEWVSLSSIAYFELGKTPDRHNEKYWHEGIYPWFSIADMHDKQEINITKEKITNLAFVEKFNGKYVPKGTLLMSFKLTVGRTSILGVDATHNEAIISIFPFFDRDFILRNYLMQTLGLLVRYVEQTEAIKGSTLNSKKLHGMLIPLPPLEEQKRIVEAIEKFEPLLAEYDKLEDQAEKLDGEIFDKLKKSILQYAIQGKLAPQDNSDEPASVLISKIKAEKEKLIKEGTIKKEKPLPPITDSEKPFDIPDSWQWVRFSDIFIFENGDRSEKYPKDYDLVEKGIPFWGAADMIDGVLRYSDSLRFISDKKFSELRSGKLLDGDFVCLLRGDVGKCAKFIAANGYLTGFINAQMIILRSIDLSLISYIELILKSEVFKKQIKENKTGTAVAQMAAKDLQSFLIPLPPLNEQKRIVARIEELFSEIDKMGTNCKG